MATDRTVSGVAFSLRRTRPRLFPASAPSAAPLAPTQLRRVLELHEIIAIGIGIIIGAGIYVLLGAATAAAGATVWLVAFLLAATLAMLTGLSYAELGSMFPSIGGAIEYAREVFPPPAVFLVGWFMVVAMVVGAAAVSLGFARYLGALPLCRSTDWDVGRPAPPFPRSQRVQLGADSSASWAGTIALMLPALPPRALLLGAVLGGVGLLVYAAKSRGRAW